ncbi:LOW QUALITY PROTEIN: melanin-concentrating hormone receptor 2 [Hypomesus transpacificus]|uniref:LOW QUALITY PROTEIN: melanin-concentrating hormone receptor 2 n=1 Tax=Hypomesus transpacificus TaxID=137520 RepID=UPI001F07A4DC|nr:LOW QUALITY PROTEIN: melanin-concentrating hormone receptor 2 [Hypomesus transpacificus]
MDDIDTYTWNQTTYPLNESGSDDGNHLDEYSNFVHVTETTILPSLIGFLCSTGLVGNILVLVTILRTTKKTVPDVYVCNLAVADVVHVTVMPFLIHQWARGGHWVFGSTLCTIITSIDNCNQVACAAVMTAVSLDRYLAVVHPLRLMTLRTRSRTIRINLCVWVVSFILVLPAWLYSEVLRFPDGLESCTMNLVSPSAVLWYTLYQTITSFFLPLPLILTCYFLILTSTWRKYLKTKQASRCNMSLPRQRAVRLTRMVLVLVGVFMVSVAPYHVLQLVNLSVRRPSLAYHTCYYLSVCLSYAPSSINPFIYILLSRHFRKRMPNAQRPATQRETASPANSMPLLDNGLLSLYAPPPL